MTPLFADSSFYVALLNRRDARHAQARAIAAAARRRILVTEFVLLETGNALGAWPQARWEFLALVRRLRESPSTHIVPATSDLLQQGLDLYGERDDKLWSVTDCISFVVMRQHGLTEALTADHHFEQAGFTVLLK